MSKTTYLYLWLMTFLIGGNMVAEEVSAVNDATTTPDAKAQERKPIWQATCTFVRDEIQQDEQHLLASLVTSYLVSVASRASGYGKYEKPAIDAAEIAVNYYFGGKEAARRTAVVTIANDLTEYAVNGRFHENEKVQRHVTNAAVTGTAVVYDHYFGNKEQVAYDLVEGAGGALAIQKRISIAPSKNIAGWALAFYKDDKRRRKQYLRGLIRSCKLKLYSPIDNRRNSRLRSPARAASPVGSKKL